MPEAAPRSSSARNQSGSPAPAPNAWRIEVFRRAGVDDPEGGHARAALAEAGVTGLADVRLGRGFLLPPGLSREAVQRAVRELLADPVLDEARIDRAARAARRERRGVTACWSRASPGSWTPSR